MLVCEYQCTGGRTVLVCQYQCTGGRTVLVCEHQCTGGRTVLVWGVSMYVWTDWVSV